MMAENQLLILGGGILNIKTIEDVKSKGFYVHVADGNAQAPCFAVADNAIHVDITDPEKVFDRVKDLKLAGIVSMAEVGVTTCAWLNEKMNLHGLSRQTAALATSKVGMRNSWADIPYSVRYRVCTTFKEMEAAFEDLGKLPLIIKPDKTYGGSRGVSKIISKEELAKAFEYAKSSGQNDKVIIEECAEGGEYSCEVLVHQGNATVLCIGGKVKSPLPYRVDCSVEYPARIDPEMRAEISKMVQQATHKIELTNGVAHVEFAITEDGPRLFELGARCGGGHTPMIAMHVSGVNEFLEYVHTACGFPVQLNLLENQRGAIYRFIIFEPGEVLKVEISKEVFEEKAVYDLVLDVKEGDVIAELKSTSQRSGACIIFSEDFDNAKRIADWVCKNIHITYSDGSKKTAMIYH
jgi:biotin carboxylase